jgi:hypothetical protein
MASIDEQFSESSRQDVLDRVAGCVLAAVIGDMAENPAGAPADEYLQAPRQLLEAAKRFDARHARMRLLAARNGEAVADVSPFGPTAQDQLLMAVGDVLDDVGGLLTTQTPSAGEAVARLVAYEKCVVDRIVRQRYGEQEIQHELELAGECRKRGATDVSKSPAKRKRRSTRKVPVDLMLGRLEKRKRDQLRRICQDDTSLYERMLDELYSCSAKDLVSPVNEELASLNMGPVSYKTIERSDKYISWEKHRKPLAIPNASVDCGLAYGTSQKRRFTAQDAAGAALMTGGLGERSRRNRRQGKGGRSPEDKAADSWAASVGASLPPAD